MNDLWKPYEPWLKDVMSRKAWTATDWCRAAGISASTLLRPLNNPQHTHGPSLTTLQALAAAAGTPAPSFRRAPPRKTRTKADPKPKVVLSDANADSFRVITVEIRIPR